jgi:hypothetical protein
VPQVPAAALLRDAAFASTMNAGLFLLLGFGFAAPAASP